jgi:hypothetical protein
VQYRRDRLVLAAAILNHERGDDQQMQSDTESPCRSAAPRVDLTGERSCREEPLAQRGWSALRHAPRPLDRDSDARRAVVADRDARRT